MSELEYLPVPVDVARRIADEFRKDWVIILAFDEPHSRTHCTTFAIGAGDKRLVADLSTVCLQAIGISLEGLRVHEDFRLVPASESARQIALLKTEIEQLKEMLSDRPAGAQ